MSTASGSSMVILPDLQLMGNSTLPSESVVMVGGEADRDLEGILNAVGIDFPTAGRHPLRPAHAHTLHHQVSPPPPSPLLLHSAREQQPPLRLIFLAALAAPARLDSQRPLLPLRPTTGAPGPPLAAPPALRRRGRGRSAQAEAHGALP
jgi:hypothetical protein